MKTTKFVYVPNAVQALISGVAYVRIAGNCCTLHYTDNTTETGTITESLSEQAYTYLLYQDGQGPETREPNFFEFVSQVQATRNLAAR